MPSLHLILSWLTFFSCEKGLGESFITKTRLSISGLPGDQKFGKGKAMVQDKNAARKSGDWFERVFGFRESGRGKVHEQLQVDGNLLRSVETGEEWIAGRLEVASLAELSGRARELSEVTGGKLKLTEVIGDAKNLHKETSNAGALFQVASQFNLLEMTSPDVSPEDGITIYQLDPTQGPACAIACAAGTVVRNYFAQVDGQIGQISAKQIDCLADIGSALGNAGGRLWRMRNGYALPTSKGLQEIDNKLQSMSTEELDQLRSKLRIGVQWDTQVTLDSCSHLVSQAYCSALPIGYSDCPMHLWERFARLILEASYEATFAASVINKANTGNAMVYLTLIGGGVFQNEHSWIVDAIRRACEVYRDAELDVRIVSYRRSNAEVGKLVDEF